MIYHQNIVYAACRYYPYFNSNVVERCVYWASSEPSKAQTHLLWLFSCIDKHNTTGREKKETSTGARSRFAHNSCFFLLWRSRVCVHFESMKIASVHALNVWEWENEWNIFLHDLNCCSPEWIYGVDWLVRYWLRASARASKICAWNMLSWGEFNHIFFSCLAFAAILPNHFVSDVCACVHQFVRAVFASSTTERYKCCLEILKYSLWWNCQRYILPCYVTDFSKSRQRKYFLIEAIGLKRHSFWHDARCCRCFFPGLSPAPRSYH